MLFRVQTIACPVAFDPCLPVLSLGIPSGRVASPVRRAENPSTRCRCSSDTIRLHPLRICWRLPRRLFGIDGRQATVASVPVVRRNTTGYISKCHFCLELRYYLFGSNTFTELRPAEMYSS